MLTQIPHAPRLNFNRPYSRHTTHPNAPPPPPTADHPAAARVTPPSIGIQLSCIAKPSQDSSRYDPTIMHEPLADTLHDVVVSRDATCSDLAAAFSVPVALVAANWLTSRSPMELPGYDRSVAVPARPALRPSRRPSVSQATLQEYADLAAAVSSKLAAYLPCSPGNAVAAPPRAAVVKRPAAARPSRSKMQALMDSACSKTEAAAPIAEANDSPCYVPEKENLFLEPTESGWTSANAARGARCGFDLTCTHGDVRLCNERAVARKSGYGLYRCAMGTGRFINDGGTWYAEMVVTGLGGEGGVTVGVCRQSQALNRLAGMDKNGVALHASGKVVCRDGEWRQVCEPLRVGDTVGLLSRGDKDGWRVKFFVNGQGVAEERLDGTDELRAVACLYRDGSEVELRCCGDDWRYRSFAARSACIGQEEVEAGMSWASMSGSEDDGCLKLEYAERPVAACSALGSSSPVLTP